MDVKKRLKEVNEAYEEKIKNLQQTQQLAEKLKVECINLEGQLLILKEFNQDK